MDQYYFSHKKLANKKTKPEIISESNAIIKPIRDIRFQRNSNQSLSINHKNNDAFPNCLNNNLKKHNLENLKQTNNFLINDGKLAINPQKMQLLSEYIQAFSNKKNDEENKHYFPSFVRKYSEFFKIIQKKTQKKADENFGNKKGIYIDQVEKTYNFAPSYNQYYLDTKSKYHQVFSDIKSKAILRNSFNSTKGKINEKQFERNKNVNKLNTLLNVQKGVIHEKTSPNTLEMESCERDLQKQKTKTLPKTSIIKRITNNIEAEKDNEFHDETKIKLKKNKKIDSKNIEDKKNKHMKLDSLNIDQNDLEMEIDDDEDLQFYVKNHLKNHNYL